MNTATTMRGEIEYDSYEMGTTQNDINVQWSKFLQLMLPSGLTGITSTTFANHYSQLNAANCCKLHLSWGIKVAASRPTTAGVPLFTLTDYAGTSSTYTIRVANTCSSTNIQKCKAWSAQFAGFLGTTLAFEVAQQATEQTDGGTSQWGQWSSCASTSP